MSRLDAAGASLDAGATPMARSWVTTSPARPSGHRPDPRTFDLMLGLLRRNGGWLSRCTREFSLLTDEEAVTIEGIYQGLLLELDRSREDMEPADGASDWPVR